MDILLAALAVLLATSAGAAVVFFIGCIDRMKYSAMLAFAAGAMAFSSVEMLSQSHAASDDPTLAIGFLLGLAAIAASEKLLPHIHRHVRNSEMPKAGKKAVVVTGTIALHNVPEGFARATAFASGPALGWFVTGAMALQDVPEGTLVSTPLSCYGVERRLAAFYGVLSGAVEAAAAVAAFFFLSSFASLVPPALAFSAGAMVYVILVELLPDAMAERMERVAALFFVAGAATAFAIASLIGV
jgi:ZIP family zinc transporter